MIPRWAASAAPSLEDFAALAEAARAALPAEFAAAARGVALRVEDFASDDLLDEMEIDDPFALTGLYDGIPLTEKSAFDQPEGPDTIWLFRRPILEEWAERGNVSLGELVTHVFVHELAHHLGWSDADIAVVDRWWD
ncbi:metallopeptidase family protein [Rhodobaculum claviforme]|uniref:Neutral zinc metallopeptidase n=1 Tax=Rhodobaculum claviforme TaxID=1549854 RepID=A0A934TL79_9RHOB|nr:metallopeptidase family protein [Rhodobaculum claviforme]MBK5927653.1 neutral zinc metallopeptidase [Rhodobaculum claviforme]